ncbi:hypothetical protein BDQ17DRAFT_1424218 [Cyathus striatus]|nr:hypothetical protein BDQ17DRAFT_1424218 [Cyathus striatus]
MALAKEELLGELWTKLGGNKKALRKFNQHLSLLRDLGEYRKQALIRVVAVQSMSEDMEDLRERVAAPELVESRVPVEVHIKGIRNGVERLKQGRMKAKGVEEATIRVY